MSEQDLNSKIERLREIRAWESHPITVEFMDELNKRRKESIASILELTPENEAQQLLHWQLIGEQRGQDLLRVIVAEQTRELDTAIADNLKTPTD